LFAKLRLQNSRDESFWERREKEEDTWRTYVETLYRLNEAIKRDRRHIITAYKAARKILPILGYIARGRIKRSEREKGNDEKNRDAFTFFSCSAHAKIDSHLVFLFLSRPKFDRLNPGIPTVSSSQHEKILGLFYREVAGCFVTRKQPRKRDSIRSKLVSKRIFPWNLRSIKISRLGLLQSEPRYLDGFCIFRAGIINLLSIECHYMEVIGIEIVGMSFY